MVNFQPFPQQEGFTMKEAFEVFDTDNNGFIDAEELKAIMVALGEQVSDEEVQGMIQEADSDGDGMIDYDEFAKMMSGC